jgi:bifunctional DNase/RNase
MGDSLIPVEIKGIVPTPGGAGVFLSDGRKIMAIFIDSSVAAAINMAMIGEKKSRPLTHDLMQSIFEGLGVTVRQVVINDYEDETYYARLHLEQENELGRSLLEIDARPSDSIALAVRQEAPIFVAAKVWEAAEDMAWALKQGESGGETSDSNQE